MGRTGRPIRPEASLPALQNSVGCYGQWSLRGCRGCLIWIPRRRVDARAQPLALRSSGLMKPVARRRHLRAHCRAGELVNVRVVEGPAGFAVTMSKEVPVRVWSR
jgi:hypothetical protein